MARILLADDDPDYARAFAVGVKALGHEIVLAESGEDALRTIQQQPANRGFDLVFLDVMMPQGGAASVLHRLVDVAMDLPVVIITGRAELYDSPLFRTGFQRAKARIRKSASLDEIGALIDDILDA